MNKRERKKFTPSPRTIKLSFHPSVKNRKRSIMNHYHGTTLNEQKKNLSLKDNWTVVTEMMTNFHRMFRLKSKMVS